MPGAAVSSTKERVQFTACMAERLQQLNLTKEQAEILLPLLPSLVASMAPLQLGEATQDDGGEYTTSQMFAKKGKNSKSTRVQNYLLVSVYSVVTKLH